MLLQSLNRLHGLFANVRDDRRTSRRNNRRNRAANSTPEQLEWRVVLSVTTTYDFVDVQNIDLTQGPTTSQPNATNLSNGGIAVSGTGGGNTDLDVFNSDLSDGGGTSNLTGTTSAIDQLSNGNLVIVTQDADSILYTIRDATGGSVVATTDLNDLDSTGPDVMAHSGGGFWIASQDVVGGGTHSDIELRRRNNNGGAIGSVIVVDNSSAIDLNPSLAELNNGFVVVAWERHVGNFETEIWMRIYTGNGGVLAGPTLVDTTGSSNHSVDVTSAPLGFAIVYVDNQWDTGTRDITLKRFTTSGNLMGTTNISNPSGTDDFQHEANPTITQLSNNLLVASWEDNRLGGANTDTFVWLIDPETGTRLGQGRNVSAGEQETDDVQEITVAGSANGRINVFHRNKTDNDVDGESFAGRRTSTSNNLGDTILGDSFIDIMHGFGGSDIMRGGGNNDQLDGGSGTDSLNGEAGQDNLTGGGHADQFVFTNVTHSPAGLTRDRITDFSKAQLDKINVAAIDGMAGTAGVNAFTQFLGSGVFTAEGQIRAFQSGPDTIVQFNTTGTSGAEMEILLVNFIASTLALTDFIVVEGFASFASAATGSRVPPGSAGLSSRLTADSSMISTPPLLPRLEITEQAARRGVRANQLTSATTAIGTVSQKRSSPTGRTGSTPLSESTRPTFVEFSQLNTLDAAFADISSLLRTL